MYNSPKATFSITLSSRVNLYSCVLKIIPSVHRSKLLIIVLIKRAQCWYISHTLNNIYNVQCWYISLTLNNIYNVQRWCIYHTLNTIYNVQRCYISHTLNNIYNLQRWCIYHTLNTIYNVRRWYIYHTLNNIYNVQRWYISHSLKIIFNAQRNHAAHWMREKMRQCIEAEVIFVGLSGMHGVWSQSIRLRGYWSLVMHIISPNGLPGNCHLVIVHPSLVVIEFLLT